MTRLRDCGVVCQAAYACRCCWPCCAALLIQAAESLLAVHVQVDTETGHMTSKGDILLALRYLRSYEHMGSFSIECISGCTCEGVSNHTAWLDWEASMQNFIFFSASLHKQCRLGIRSLPETDTGAHKVSLDMLMVSTGVGAEWVRLNRIFKDWDLGI